MRTEFNQEHLGLNWDSPKGDDLGSNHRQTQMETFTHLALRLHRHPWQAPERRCRTGDLTAGLPSGHHSGKWMNLWSIFFQNTGKVFLKNLVISIAMLNCQLVITKNYGARMGISWYRFV